MTPVGGCHRHSRGAPMISSSTTASTRMSSSSRCAADARRSSLQPLLADALLRARWGATRIPGARPLAVVGAPSISENAAEDAARVRECFRGEWMDAHGCDRHGRGCWRCWDQVCRR